MSNVKDFLKRKDIVITPQRYLIEALGAMAQGLFASLLIGTIIKTLGQQTGLDVLVDLGGYATPMSTFTLPTTAFWFRSSATPWTRPPVKFCLPSSRTGRSFPLPPEKFCWAAAISTVSHSRFP